MGKIAPRRRRIISFAGVVASLVILWEGYKLIWSFFGWIEPVRPDNVVMPSENHQQWQLNEILGLIFPASNGIGVMNENLWNQTVDLATTEIPDLAGVEVSADAYRTDLAEEAIANLSDMDTDGSSYERRDIELRPGGE